MNNKDLLKAIGDIDEKYLIQETEVEDNKTVNIVKKSKIRYILAPICIIFIAILGVHIASKPENVISKNDNWIIKEIKVDNNIIIPSIAIVPKWDELPVNQQFFEVEYNNNTYSSNVAKISNDNIMKKLGESILKGYDSDTNTTYNKKGELYSIKGLSDKCVVAVKFEGDTCYYVYINAYYRPNTLGEFIDDLNLKEIISFGKIYYKYWDKDLQTSVNVEFYDVDNKVIWDMLFDNSNLENIYKDTETFKYKSERFSQSIDISVDIPLLGRKNISVELTDKGYLITNILDTGKGFYIGENKVQEFLDYIKENYDGYRMVYIYENEKEIPESERNDEIVMIDNTTHNTTIVNINTTTQNRTEAREF